MEYQIAKPEYLSQIVEMKDRVKQRIIDQNLPMWLNGYPLNEYIFEDVENKHGRVVIINGKVAAYAAFYPATYAYQDELDDIEGRYSFGRVMVDDEFIGLGVGKFLVSSMIDEAKRLVNKGMLITGDDFNTKAMNLYKGLGFNKIGEKQFSYAYLSVFILNF